MGSMHLQIDAHTVNTVKSWYIKQRNTGLLKGLCISKAICTEKSTTSLVCLTMWICLNEQLTGITISALQQMYPIMPLKENCNGKVLIQHSNSSVHVFQYSFWKIFNTYKQYVFVKSFSQIHILLLCIASVKPICFSFRGLPLFLCRDFPYRIYLWW